jgi:hypothetical protein
VQDIEIRPAILVWDVIFQRWIHVRTGYDLLRLLDVILRERPHMTREMPGAGQGHDPPARHDRLHALIAQIESEMEIETTRLSVQAQQKSIALIGRQRIVRNRNLS